MTADFLFLFAVCAVMLYHYLLAFVQWLAAVIG